MDRTILRLPEVSERLGIPVATLRYWRHLGTGPRSYKLGAKVVYDAAEIDRWVAQQRELAESADRDGARTA
jgi:predicted DNA-binding transcriptional regulator AlpA